VFRTHYALCEFENIADTEYTKHDIFSEVESQYLQKQRLMIFCMRKNQQVIRLVVIVSTNVRICFQFDGNLNNWEDFRDMFVAVVHNDKTMPLIKKMHYLKGCLKGEAAGVISKIELSGMERHGHSLLSVLIIRNDESWKVIYAVCSKLSHSLKHQRRVSMHRWILSSNLRAR